MFLTIFEVPFIVFTIFILNIAVGVELIVVKVTLILVLCSHVLALPMLLTVQKLPLVENSLRLPLLSAMAVRQVTRPHSFVLVLQFPVVENPSTLRLLALQLPLIDPALWTDKTTLAISSPLGEVTDVVGPIGVEQLALAMWYPTLPLTLVHEPLTIEQFRLGQSARCLERVVSTENSSFGIELIDDGVLVGCSGRRELNHADF